MKRVHPDFGESNFFATQLNEVTQLSGGRGADRATLLEVVEGSTNIDGQTDEPLCGVRRPTGRERRKES